MANWLPQGGELGCGGRPAVGFATAKALGCTWPGLHFADIIVTLNNVRVGSGH
jgi:hypothetical protein